MFDSTGGRVAALNDEFNAPQVRKRYQGNRSQGQVCVTVNGRPLNPRTDLRNHSPDGFEWGYGGSGPSQLALALLADCLNDERRALALHQDFKWKVVAGLPHDSWTLTDSEIDRALQSIASEQKGASA